MLHLHPHPLQLVFTHPQQSSAWGGTEQEGKRGGEGRHNDASQIRLGAGISNGMDFILHDELELWVKFHS
jgi:hypothetical protein